MNTKTRKVLALFAAVCMIISVFPLSAVNAQAKTTSEGLSSYLTPQEALQTIDTITSKSANKKPTLFIASDSVAKAYGTSRPPRRGWGEFITDHLTTKVNLKNYSDTKLSSKLYYTDGHFEKLLKEVKKGDIVLLAFGANDHLDFYPDRYTPVGNKIKNPKEGTYEYYMEQMAFAIQKKKATPVFIAPTIRYNSYNKTKKKFYETLPEYRKALKKMAKEYNVDYIDINAIMVKDFNKKSHKTITKYYCGPNKTPADNDYTHFTKKGADVVAKLICTKLNGIVKRVTK